uniref:Uncharacterized protein n=1 Tax=Macaca nemestrina TaxID=9545 RepID=A0A2K6E5M5_MACNE
MPEEPKPEPEKHKDSLNMWLCPSRKQALKVMVPCRISDSFQVIKNSSLSECPKEDRAGKPKLKSPMTTSWCPFNTADWVLPGQKMGNLSQLSSAEDKWLLGKKAQEEEHNFLLDHFGLPAVCDLFACRQLKADKEKWLHQIPLQM